MGGVTRLRAGASPPRTQRVFGTKKGRSAVHRQQPRLDSELRPDDRLGSPA